MNNCINQPKIASTMGRSVMIAMYDCNQMSGEQLADEVGTSPAMISYIVKGKKVPSLALLERIAKALGTTPAKLISDTTNKDKGD